MIKHLYILFVLLMYSVICLSQNYCIEYTGSATAYNVNGEETYVYTKNSGSWSNIVITVSVPPTESIKHNSQSIINSSFTTNINFDSHDIEYDTYGNEIHVFTFIGNPSSVSVTREYNATLSNYIPTNNCLSDNFPVNNIPGDIQQFLDPTTNIQSGNSSIISLAFSITSGCSTMHEAVGKISEWVRGNISYSLNGSQDAVSVFSRKTGNCSGFTNLSIALLRSIGIPARYVGGVLLPKSYSLPFRTNGSYTISGGGPGSHATHEIYYPSIGNWVRNDGQQSVNFSTVNFVKFAHGKDQNEISVSMAASGSPDLTFTSSLNVSSTIGSVSANYVYKGDHVFSGTNNSEILIKGFIDCVPTGIFDKVEIVSGPDEFKTGEGVIYQATFTSGNGNTYPTNWSWQILLYHSSGTYTLCSNSNGSNLWGPATNPVLPSYNWLIDPLGNIYGEVIVAVNISDGDYKTARLPVSVEECNELYLLNKTYTSNTTKQGCYVTLENVNVQNNAKLTIHSEMGTTIKKNFTMTSGTQLQVD